jgi:uncharacterized protein (TIGR03435 family)
MNLHESRSRSNPIGAKTLPRANMRTPSVVLATLIATSAFAQTPLTPAPLTPAKDGPAFEISDVHISPKAANMYVRTSPPRDGRYEIHSATMVDLIRIAWGFDADKILSGPSWLEMNHYDVIAKVPADATLETTAPMLQSLLAERFRLTAHKDTRSLPSYVLTAGKKPLLKEANDTGDTGCRPEADSTATGPGNGGGMLMMSGPDGKTTQIALGPNSLIRYRCHNITMEAFAAALRNMVGASLGQNPILDQTGIKGAWNFDVRYSLGFGGMAGVSDRIGIQDAVDKQLGLKLEERPLPVAVLVVDSVDEKPAPNPPGASEALPVIAPPTEFDVADIKPTDPAAMVGMIGMRMQPGGRFVGTGVPLTFLVQRAFPNLSSDQIIGLQGAANSGRFDINAKTSPSIGTNPDQETMGALVLSLLKERFGFKYHAEERPLPAYSLVAVKPKAKKADPASRTHCIRSNAPTGSPPGTTVLTCQNITMAQFAEQLRGVAQGLNVPPVDATALEGAWDFVLTWNQRAGMNIGPAARPPEGGPANDLAPASDPTAGYTIFEAVDKQLGLKLEMQKRPVPVIVIDHLEQKPTDN